MKRILLFSLILAIFALFSACGGEESTELIDLPTLEEIMPPESEMLPIEVAMLLPNTDNSNNNQVAINPRKYIYNVLPKQAKNLKAVSGCLANKNIKASIGFNVVHIYGSVRPFAQITINDLYGVTASVNAVQNGQFSIIISNRNVQRGAEINVSASGQNCITEDTRATILLSIENLIPPNTPACMTDMGLFSAVPDKTNGGIAIFIWQSKMPNYYVTVCDKKGVCTTIDNFGGKGYLEANLPDTNTLLDENVYAVVQGYKCASTIEIKLCKG